MKFLKNLGSRGESSMTQTLLVSALIIAAFFIGMLWTKVQNLESGRIPSKVAAGAPTAGVGSDPNPTAYDEPDLPREIDPITDTDWVRGNRNARYALINYTDLECPFCKQFHATAQQMLSSYGDKVMWVYRHFPLEQLHSKAKPEAIAVQCAGIIGGEAKFWQYIDSVYQTTTSNDGLDLTALPKIAAQVGLNSSQFDTCTKSQEALDAVDEGLQSGFRAQINGTPGNLLYDTQTGKYVELAGAVPYATLKSELDKFIAGAETQ